MHALLSLVFLAAALTLIGFLYQWIGGYRDRQRYAGSGRWVMIERGCKLYLLEKGSGGPNCAL